MKRKWARRGAKWDAQIQQAQERIEQVEARIQKATTEVELQEGRRELAETRTELAKTRTALAEIRAEQAETTLQHVIQNGIDVCNELEVQPVKKLPSNGIPDTESTLEQLTSRQREILQHIAEGRNTKQIGETLHLSPKTVEYHRAKLMRAVGVHDIPGLVRLAVRAGLVPAES